MITTQKNNPRHPGLITMHMRRVCFKHCASLLIRKSCMWLPMRAQVSHLFHISHHPYPHLVYIFGIFRPPMVHSRLSPSQLSAATVLASSIRSQVNFAYVQWPPFAGMDGLTTDGNTWRTTGRARRRLVWFGAFVSVCWRMSRWVAYTSVKETAHTGGDGGQCRWRFRWSNTEPWASPKTSLLVFTIFLCVFVG